MNPTHATSGCRQRKKRWKDRTIYTSDFARWSSMTVMTQWLKKISSFHICRTILHVRHLEGGLGAWQVVMWTWKGVGIRWCTSRTIGGRKGERKKERFIGPLRRRMFPIFPDSTAGMMCVMQYAGTMTLRKWTMTLSRWTMTLSKCLTARKDPRQYPKSGHRNGLSYIPTHTLSYIIEWPCIELVGSWQSLGLPVSLLLPLRMLCKVCLFLPIFILRSYVLLCSSWCSILWCKNPASWHQCREHYDFGERRRILDWLGHVCSHWRRGPAIREDEEDCGYLPFVPRLPCWCLWYFRECDNSCQ